MSNRFPILLTEDDLVSRKMLEKSLLSEGYEVTSVENGRKALRLFKNKFFPIVITDWIMPEMDGLELCRAIRRENSKGYVFIIIVTVKDSKNDIVEGLEAGADDYLTKPIDRAELLARIRTGIRILKLEKSLWEANKEIRVLSITDVLTGSYNRRYLNIRLPQEIKRSMRYNHSLSLIWGDIDNFKRINDLYGHQTGDQVLKEFVQCATLSFRNNIDWLVRYGGDEFLIVLPETNLSGAYAMAKRLCSVVSKRTIKAQGKEIHITASFGVTGFNPDTPDEKISPEAMINKADKYVYKAKQKGRNRVEKGKL